MAITETFANFDLATGANDGSSEANAWQNWASIVFAAGSRVNLKRTASRFPLGSVSAAVASTDGNPVILRAYESAPGDGGIFEASDVNFIVSPGGTGMHIEGLDFLNSTESARPFQIQAENVQLTNCRAEHTNTGSGNRSCFGMLADGGTLYNCVGIMRGTRGLADGAAVGTFNNRWSGEGCFFSGSGNAPVVEAPFNSRDTQIKNCVLQGNGQIGVYCAGNSPSGNGVISGNSFHNCNVAVYFLNGMAYGQNGQPVFANNVMWGITQYGFQDITNLPTSAVTLYNNAIDSSALARLNGMGDAVEYLPITLTADPYVDAANGDYRLNDAPGGGALCRQGAQPQDLGQTGSRNQFLDLGGLQSVSQSGTLNAIGTEAAIWNPSSDPAPGGLSIADQGPNDNGHTATLNTAASWVSDTGAEGVQAIELTGTQQASAADSDDFTPSTGSADLPFWVSIWIKPTSDGAAQGLVSKNATSLTMGEWMLYRTGQTLTVLIIDQDGGSSNNAFRVTDSALTIDEWNCVYADYDGSGQATGLRVFTKTYGNSFAEATYTNTTTGSNFTRIRNTAEVVKIGRHTGTGFYTGRFDDVRVSVGARLDVAQRDALGARRGGAAVQSGEDSPLLKDLVAWYGLHEQEALADAADQHRGNLTAIGSGNGRVQQPGKVTFSRQFDDGTNTYYILNDGSAFTFTSNFFIAVWIYLDAASGTRVFANVANETNNRRVWSIGRHNATGLCEFKVSSDGVNWDGLVRATTFGAFVADTWYLCVGYHSAADNEVGVAVNPTALTDFDTAAHTAGLFATTEPFNIGRAGHGPFGMLGRMCELGAWPRKPTDDDIAALWNNGSGTTIEQLRQIGGGGGGDVLAPIRIETKW